MADAKAKSTYNFEKERIIRKLVQRLRRYPASTLTAFEHQLQHAERRGWLQIDETSSF